MSEWETVAKDSTPGPGVWDETERMRTERGWSYMRTQEYDRRDYDDDRENHVITTAWFVPDPVAFFGASVPEHETAAPGTGPKTVVVPLSGTTTEEPLS